jgi:hypothetical protein
VLLCSYCFPTWLSHRNCLCLTAELAAKGADFVKAARHSDGAEHVLAAVTTLSPAELAAKGGELFVEAALSAGAAEQLLAAANTFSPEELVAKPLKFLVAMAIASAGADATRAIPLCWQFAPQARRCWLVTSYKSSKSG